MALSLLMSGYLSPELRLNKKVDYVASSYHYPPPLLHGSEVNPPTILSDYVSRMVSVFGMPLHF
jgi:hypothetical protein